MTKRRACGIDQHLLQRSVKHRASGRSDELSQLSDELLLRILAYVPVPTLSLCQRISKRFRAIAGDSQLWKAAYYNRFVRPRVLRLPGIKDTYTTHNLRFSPKLSKWLDEAGLVTHGKETNWKRQYKLRHNWSRGKCHVNEMVLSEAPPASPLLVHLHDGIIYTADAIAGLRAWSTKQNGVLLASICWGLSVSRTSAEPTSLTVDTERRRSSHKQLAVGFGDGCFSIYRLTIPSMSFNLMYKHPVSSNGRLSALAFAFPHLTTMTDMKLLSLYKFTNEAKDGPISDTLDSPRLLYSLRSHTAWPPVSISIRCSSQDIVPSIAYALPTYLSGWTVAIQEMRITPDGRLLESRLALADAPGSHPWAPNVSLSSSDDAHVRLIAPCSQPTSLSYTHPYLLSSHPDNTLMLYLVTSTASSLHIGPGTRLWGHTSSVSGAQVGGRGKAVSVSAHGDELRVWELEGGAGSRTTTRSHRAREAGIRISRERKKAPTLDLNLTACGTFDSSSIGVASGERPDEMTAATSWIGFDEEQVIVLHENSKERRTLVVYDFT